MPYHDRPARLRWLPFVLCASIATLAGCGQKGPLYLPDEARAPAETVPDGNGKDESEPKQKRDGG